MLSTIEENPVTDKSSPKRIYISREDATRRRVHNFDEVHELLQSFGFAEYKLSDHSVREQVALFANADVIVSPHGAGLTNIIFSTSASIIELFGETKKSTYYRLAEFMGHEYQPLPNSEYKNDLIVDIRELEEKLNEVCSE